MNKKIVTKKQADRIKKMCFLEMASIYIIFKAIAIFALIDAILHYDELSILISVIWLCFLYACCPSIRTVTRLTYRYFSNNYTIGRKSSCKQKKNA